MVVQLDQRKIAPLKTAVCKLLPVINLWRQQIEKQGGKNLFTLYIVFWAKNGGRMCGRKSRLGLVILALLLLASPLYSSGNDCEEIEALLIESQAMLSDTATILSEYEEQAEILQRQSKSLQARVKKLRTRQQLLTDSLIAAKESERRLQTSTAELSRRYRIAATTATISTILAISLGAIIIIK